MQQIRIDFDNPGLPQSLGVVEGESQSRIFQAALYKSGAAYTAPAGAVYSIMYRGFGPQNQGWYDTIEDGAGKRAACTVSGNVVTCELARQALRVPGHLTVVLCVSDAKGYMLKSWPIMADVRNDGYEDTGEIEMYFNLSDLAENYLTQLEKAMADAETTRNNLTSTSAQAKKDIDAKAAETLKTIPESYTELDGNVKQLKEDSVRYRGALKSNKKLNEVVMPGIYIGSTNSVDDAPQNETGQFSLVHLGDNNFYTQILTFLVNGHSYIRAKTGSVVTEWDIFGNNYRYQFNERVDLDTVKTVGSYYIEGDKVKTNNTLRLHHTSKYLLYVKGTATTTNILYQTLVDLSVGSCYIRSFISNNWSNWLNTTEYCGSIIADSEENVDIDTLYACGLYFSTGGQLGGTHPEIPSSNWCLLKVFGLTGDTPLAICQEFYDIQDKKSFIRFMRGSGAWSEWNCVTNGTYNGNVPQGSNADEFFSIGCFYFRQSYFTAGTLPTTFGEYDSLYIKNEGTAGILVQTITNVTANSQYVRTYTDSKWSKWKNMTISTPSTSDTRLYNVWQGSIANVIGDSIVAGNMWQPTMSQLLGLSNVVNYGVGGSCIASSDLDSTYPPAVKRYETMADNSAEIIIVHSGTNDYSAQIPLGSADSTDITTFNGALNVMMQGLRAKYPGSLIVFNNIISRYTDNADTKTIKCDEYREAIKERCIHNHVQFNDTYKNLCFDWSSAGDKYGTLDGLHPNEAGGKIMGREVSGFISSH